MKVKECFKCKEIKPFEDFGRTKKAVSKTYCRNCENLYNREYYSNKKNDPIFIIQRRTKARQLRETSRNTRILQMFHTLKNGSRRRNRTLDFELTRELLHALFILQDWKCKQTGIPFDFSTGKGKRPFGPTVDRIDNSKGYSLTNIQIVCNVYNLAKSNFQTEDVLIFAKALVEKQGKNS